MYLGQRAKYLNKDIEIEKLMLDLATLLKLAKYVARKIQELVLSNEC